MEEDFDEFIDNKYNFGIAGQIIWFTHIIIGLILAYTGYLIYYQQSINKNIGLLFMFCGIIAILYHAYLWYMNA